MNDFLFVCLFCYFFGFCCCFSSWLVCWCVPSSLCCYRCFGFFCLFVCLFFFSFAYLFSFLQGSAVFILMWVGAGWIYNHLVVKKLTFVILELYTQGGPQKCSYFSLAITFTKIRKPSRFILHRYWRFIEFFWCKQL